MMLALFLTDRQFKNPKTSKEVDNPWFNEECRNRRKLYCRARGKYRRSKSDIDKYLVDQACKKYKNTMQLARREYTKKTETFPKTQKKLTPRILEAIKSETEKGVSIESFYKHLQKCKKCKISI